MTDAPLRLGYIVSRFPRVPETFLAREVRGLQDLGMEVELFTLVRESADVVHPEAEPLLSGLHHARLRDRRVAFSQVWWLCHHPIAYLRTWVRAVRGNASSPKFLVRAIAVVFLGAHHARAMQGLGIGRTHAAWATHAALMAWVVHELTDIPFGFTCHAHDLYVDRSMLDRKLADADLVVTISDYNRRLICDDFGADACTKTHTVRLGVDVAQYRSPEATGTDRTDAARSGPLQLLCVASLEEYKGHRHLLDACAELDERGVDFRLRLVFGSDELREDLEQQVGRLGIGPKVTFVGPLSTDEVRDELARADVVVLASIVTPTGKAEGIPVSLMEAMAMERPVVASRLTGIPELVDDGQNGLLVPPGEPAAIAAAVASLLDPERRAQLGRRGRATVEEKYDLRRNQATLHELIDAAPRWSAPPTAGVRTTPSWN